MSEKALIVAGLFLLLCFAGCLTDNTYFIVDKNISTGDINGLTWNELAAIIPWADDNVADDITLTNLTQITTRSYTDLQNLPNLWGYDTNVWAAGYLDDFNAVTVDGNFLVDVYIDGKLYVDDIWDNGQGHIDIGTSVYIDNLWVNNSTYLKDVNAFDVNANNFYGGIFYGDGSGLTGLDKNSNDVNIGHLADSNYFSLQDWINTVQSAGRIGSLLTVSNGDGSMTVGSGDGFIKVSDANVATTLLFSWDGNNNVGLTDQQVNHVYIAYNGGNPVVQVTLDESRINGRDEFEVCHVFRDGVELHIAKHGVNLTDSWNKLTDRLHEGEGHVRASGLVASETGTRNIAITAGRVWAELIPYDIAAFDSSGIDTFSYWFYNGSSWIEGDGNSTIDNAQYNDITLGLADVANNRYGVHWVYVLETGSVHVVYGQNSYKLTEAQGAAAPSSMPKKISYFGILIARIIVLKDGAGFSEVGVAWDTPFTFSGVESHNQLADLQGGTVNEYYHLTQSDYDFVQDRNFIAAETISINIVAGSGSGATAGDLNVYIHDFQLIPLTDANARVKIKETDSGIYLWDSFANVAANTQRSVMKTVFNDSLTFELSNASKNEAVDVEVRYE